MMHLFSALLCIAMAAGLNQDGNKMAYDRTHGALNVGALNVAFAQENNPVFTVG